MNDSTDAGMAVGFVEFALEGLAGGLAAGVEQVEDEGVGLAVGAGAEEGMKEC